MAVSETLYRQIRDFAFYGLTPSPQPFFMAALGGPGAGISTALDAMQTSGLIDKNVLHIHSVLFNKLPGYKELQKKSLYPEKEPALVEDYHEIVHRLMSEARERHISILLEDDGDHPEQYKPMLKELKAKHYQTFLLGMSVPPECYMQIQREIDEKRRAKNPDYCGNPGLLQARKSLRLHKDFALNWENKLVPLFDGAVLYRMGLDQEKNTLLHCLMSYEKMPDGTMHVVRPESPRRQGGAHPQKLPSAAEDMLHEFHEYKNFDLDAFLEADHRREFAAFLASEPQSENGRVARYSGYSSRTPVPAHTLGEAVGDAREHARPGRSFLDLVTRISPEGPYRTGEIHGRK